MSSSVQIPERKQRLIGAAVALILRQGYAATTIDQICAQAGVTKGSFFHYFANKEEICRAALETWIGAWHSILEEARFEEIPDPLDRVFRLFDVMESAYLYPGIEAGCLTGTVAQETGLQSGPMAELSAAHLGTWVEGTTRLLREAKEAYSPAIEFEPESLAWFLMGMVQGTLLIAKTQPERQVVANNIGHCRAYVRALFGIT